MGIWLASLCTLMCFIAPVRAAADCIEVNAALDAQFPAAASLDSALASTGNSQSATLCLIPSNTAFVVDTRASVSSNVVVRGNGQVINFLKMLFLSGSLTILNATLTSTVKSAEFPILALSGSLHIHDSTITSFAANLVVGSGSVEFVRISFFNNIAPAIVIDSEGDTVMQIVQCTVWNHTAEFARIVPTVLCCSILIYVENATFMENRGVGYLFDYSAPVFLGSFSIVNSEFVLNEIPLMYFDTGENQISIRNSTFANNTHSTLIANAKGSVFIIENSTWTGNSDIIFNFREIIGILQVTGITVANQRWKGVFQLRNTQSPEQCRFRMLKSSFVATYFKVDEPSPGIMHAYGCTVEITDALISNVRMAAVHQLDLEGLIFLRFGNMAISRMTLRASGTTASGIGVAMGNFTITDSTMCEIQSGVGLYLGSIVGSMYAQNVSLSHGERFPPDDGNIGASIMYYGAWSSHMKLRNVSVLPSRWYADSDPLFVIFSSVDVSGFSIQDRRCESLGYFVEAKGIISNITVVNCVFDFSVFYVNNIDLLVVAGVDVRDSSIGILFSHGFIAGTPMLNITCVDVTITNVTAGYLLASKKAQVRMSNISITDSTFEYFLKNQVDSSIFIEKMIVKRSTAVLTALFRSSLHVLDSSFTNFTSSSVIFSGGNANFTLERTAMKNVASPSGLSDLTEKSHLTISQSIFENYESSASEGFYHDTGTLVITDSSFRAFNTAFIQASSSSVFIANSVFQEGSSKALSRTSQSAYGGALRCRDCLSLVVENTAFLNVSAIFGGAIAAQTSNGIGSAWVRIRNCEFVKCSAAAGGAVYVKQASLLVEESTFLGNEAESTGGAMEIYSSNGQFAEIRNCAFYRNSAHEGGAVKWNDAEVSFVSVTFQDNSAFYGPDIASYGIKLSGSVPSSNGTEASGYPLQLIFELQDHYGQRVKTASTQYFQLSHDNQVNYLGNTVSIIDQGIFNFSHLTVYAQPHSEQKVSGTMLTSQNGQMVTVNASVDIIFRDCVPGEVRKSDRCEYCFAGFLSFSPSDSNCSYCPKNAFCPGGNALIVNSYYWRNSTASASILLCPLRATCLGGGNSDCAEGYTGQVCNECAEGYTRHRTLECRPCSSRIFQGLKVAVTVIPIVGLYLAVNRATDIQFFILKIGITHAQLLSTLNYFRMIYPPAISYSLHSLSYISSLFITDLPISCFTSNHSEYMKAVVGSAMPLVLSLLFILRHRRDIKKAWIFCTSAMMFTPMASLATQLPLLSCQSVESAEKYLFIDMQEKCWRGRHLLLITALLIPSVIINVILPVALVAGTALISPQKFDDLFPLWRSGVKWRCWDVWIYSFKGILLSLLIISITEHQLCQLVYGLTVLIIVSVIAAGTSTHAYIHWKWVFLTESSLVIVAISMGLCAYFIYNLPGQGVTDWLVTAGFLALNAGYFATCVKLWKDTPNLQSELVDGVVPPAFSVPPNSVVGSLG